MALEERFETIGEALVQCRLSELDVWTGETTNSILRGHVMLRSLTELPGTHKLG